MRGSVHYRIGLSLHTLCGESIQLERAAVDGTRSPADVTCARCAEEIDRRRRHRTGESATLDELWRAQQRAAVARVHKRLGERLAAVSDTVPDGLTAEALEEYAETLRRVARSLREGR